VESRKRLARHCGTGSPDQYVCWDATSGNDYIDTPELGEALDNINGDARNDLLAFDACLMSMLEVAYEISPYADYMVASEELIPVMALRMT
jgi:hypothetical protein